MERYGGGAAARGFWGWGDRAAACCRAGVGAKRGRGLPQAAGAFPAAYFTPDRKGFKEVAVFLAAYGAGGEFFAGTNGRPVGR
jgi:hypothetical protein